MESRYSKCPSPAWVIALLAVVLSSNRISAQIILNEILADNRSAVANGGDHPDYIELHNPSAVPVDISGWSLTDDSLLPRKFVFVAGTSVPANGFLVVWADLNMSAPGLHTGFGLGAKGDLVRLYAADGATVRDEISFGMQVADLSLGRVPDGSGTWMLNQPSAGLANTAAPTGDAGQLRLNEWLSKASVGEDWLEVFNAADQAVPLAGLVITDQPTGTPANRAIPAHSFIAARGFAQFFASDLEEDSADHLDFKLSTDGEALTIYAADRTTVLDRVVFDSQTQDVSQGRAPDGSDNFVFFPGSSATPGASNFRELTNVVVSEVLSHSDPPFEDAIELQNLTSAPADISHWWLSDSGSKPRKLRIPAGTVIPAHGFKVFYHAQFGVGTEGFALSSAEGDDVFLSAADAAGNLTGAQTFVRFGPLKNGVSVGRHVTSMGVDFVPLSEPTFGADAPDTVVEFRQGTGQTNVTPRIPAIVINEIMFHPPDAGGLPNTDDEFIELHNRGSVVAFLYDQLFPTNTWRLRDGVSFDFPRNLGIPAGGFLLLVSFDPAANPAKLATFRTKHNVPADVAVIGPYAGKLSDNGEALEFLEPDAPEGLLEANPGLVPYMLAERISYSSGAPWPTGAAGTGHSLQRRSASAYGNEPLNWSVAAPTAGRFNTGDSDGDGMPDAWEEEHDLELHSPSDATADADRDGANNLQEYQAGTDPRDGGSMFAFTSVREERGAIWLRFHAVHGRTYSLQARDLPASESWQAVTNLTINGDTGPVEVLVDGAADKGRLFRMLTPTTP